MRSKNHSFYFTLLDLLKQGKNPAQITKELTISKQKINYYIRQLKKEGQLIKRGYGVWEIKQVKKIGSDHPTQKPKEIRGHAFIWTIKLPKKFNWKELLNIDYKLVRGNIPRLIIKNKKIWLGQYTITIYEPHSFYGRNAIESKKYAVISLLEVLGLLEQKLGINLKPYLFKPAREHYGIIKNDLAQQCNRKGEKLHIHDNLEGEWLWIDDSLQLGELETGGTKALVRNIQVQNWWNDMKKHNFEVTPSFLLESMNQVTQNQMMFAKNIEQHMNILNEMSKTLKKIQEGLDK